MPFKSREIRVVLGLILALAVVSMGCGVTQGLVGVSAEPTADPTRTPWPTFTPTPESVVLVATQDPSVVKLSDLATAEIPPPDTPPTAPPSADTPTPPLPPTDTPPPIADTPVPPPPPTNTRAPAPPPPADTPAPAPTPQPQFQFTPAPWYGGERNDAIVRFYGYLKDTGGTPVNGYSVRATCGDFAVLSFPSGPSVVAPNWAPGWYDIVFPNPISCNFTLQVVEYQCNTPGFFDAQCQQYQGLSEAVAVTTNVAAGETIIVADWVKNW
jgi:hypothetical protein